MPQPRDSRTGSIRRQRAIAALVLAALVVVLIGVVLGSHRTAHARSQVAVSVRGSRAPATRNPTASSTAVRPVSTTTTSSTVAPAPTTTIAPARTTTRAAAGALASVAGKVIAIDPGHNGENWKYTSLINQPVDIGTESRACDTTGTETADGYTESAYNLDVALRVASILRAAGATVVLTRTNNDGWGPCINERAAIGNRAHAAVAISIHADGGPASGHGFHVLYPKSIAGLTAAIAPASLRLAYDIRNAYHAGTGMPYATYIGDGDGLMPRTDLGGLNLSTVPKVFIETGNMQNVSDASRLETPSFRQQAAEAIADGLAAYLAGR